MPVGNVNHWFFNSIDQIDSPVPPEMAATHRRGTPDCPIDLTRVGEGCDQVRFGIAVDILHNGRAIR